MTDETRQQQTPATAPTDEELVDQAAEAVQVQAAELGELSEAQVRGEALGMDKIMDVPVRVTVEVGRARMPLGELVKLTPGSLVTLDREAHEPVDILVNGKVVAHGEVVTLGKSYGVRVTRVHVS